MFSADDGSFNEARRLFPDGPERDSDFSHGRDGNSMRIFCNTDRIEALQRLSDALEDGRFALDLQTIMDRLNVIRAEHVPLEPAPDDGVVRYASPR